MRIMNITNNQQNRQNQQNFTAVKLIPTNKLYQLLASDAIKDIEMELGNVASRKGKDVELEFAQTLPLNKLKAEQYFILKAKDENGIPYVGSFEFNDLHSSSKSSDFCYAIINTVRKLCGYNV